VERRAGLDVDGHGRLLVYPISGIAHAAPAQLLPAATGDAALGEAILTAIGRSEPDREDSNASIAEHRSSCTQLGVSEKDFLGYPGVTFVERRRRRRRPPMIALYGWKPAGGGWEPFDAEQVTVPADDPTALACEARSLLARIPSTRRTPPGERTGVPFGYKTAWLAVRSADTAAVCRALELTDVTEISWEAGIQASDRGLVFVSPPTAGWVLAVGVDLAHNPPDPVELSAQLDTEVQSFATHRVVEAHRWERADKGTLERRLVYVGERNEAAATGEPTAIERSLGFDWAIEQPSAPPDHSIVPDEEAVMQVAGAWSLDPRELADTPTSSDLGVSGRRSP
jgi:hypothetical protein